MILGEMGEGLGRERAGGGGEEKEEGGRRWR